MPRVTAKRDFPGVPKGTTGVVLTQDDGACNVQWDHTREITLVAARNLTFDAPSARQGMDPMEHLAVAEAEDTLETLVVARVQELMAEARETVVAAMPELSGIEADRVVSAALGRTIASVFTDLSDEDLDLGHSVESSWTPDEDDELGMW